MGWYGYFGNPSIESQWFTPEYLRNQNYLEQNYLIEPEPLDDLNSGSRTSTTTEITLRPFSPSIPKTGEIETTVDTEAIIQVEEGYGIKHANIKKLLYALLYC